MSLTSSADRRWPLLFCTVLAWLIGAPLTAWAQATPSQASVGPTPWHLVDLWWELDDDVPFESYALEVTIEGEVPTDVRLYVAPIGLGHLGSTPFYGGIQTQSDGHRKDDRRLRQLGPGLLMSMWNERRLEAIRPSEGGYCQSSGHEGDFVSIRRPYRWESGTYTYRIAKMEQEQIDGEDFTWVGAFLYSHARDENIFIGALRFPGKELRLKKSVASFVEIYGRAIPVSSIPAVEVSFGPLRVNGQQVVPRRVSSVYPKAVPDVARCQWDDGQVKVTIGPEPFERTGRRERLFDAQAEEGK